MPVDLSMLPPICEHCIAAKQTKTPVPKTRGGKQAEKKLEKVHSDIIGPEDVGTTILGRNTCWTLWTTTLAWHGSTHSRRNQMLFASFQEWKALVKNENGKHIKIFHSDNGGKYTSQSFCMLLAQQGYQPPDHYHCIHLLKTVNLNAYTGSIMNCARAHPFRIKTSPQYVGKSHEGHRLYEKLHNLPGHWQTKLL